MHKKDAENNAYEIEIMDGSEENVDEKHENNQPEDLSNSNDVINETNGVQSDKKYFDQLQRLKAEFSNYKRRVQNEQLMLSDLIKSDFATKLLPILDDFERLINHGENENFELTQAIKLVYEKFYNVLAEQGLKLVESLGNKFDPKFHEAMLVEHRKDLEDDSIIEEWRKGYLFKDRLLRPAQVKVNKMNFVDE